MEMERDWIFVKFKLRGQSVASLAAMPAENRIADKTVDNFTSGNILPDMFCLTLGYWNKKHPLDKDVETKIKLGAL